MRFELLYHLLCMAPFEIRGALRSAHAREFRCLELRRLGFSCCALGRFLRRLLRSQRRFLRRKRRKRCLLRRERLHLEPQPLGLLGRPARLVLCFLPKPLGSSTLELTLGELALELREASLLAVRILVARAEAAIRDERVVEQRRRVAARDPPQQAHEEVMVLERGDAVRPDVTQLEEAVHEHLACHLDLGARVHLPVGLRRLEHLGPVVVDVVE